MAIVKMSLKILLLFFLCMPIIYLEYYILKNTAKDIKRKRQVKETMIGHNKENNYEKKYLRIAK